MPVRVGVVLALLLLTAPTSAVAQPSRGDARTHAAREHFDRGTKLYDLARYQEAAQEFEKAYLEVSDSAFLFNIAQSWRQAGDTGRALTFYRKYLGKLEPGPRRTEVEQRIADLERAQRERTEAPTPAVP